MRRLLARCATLVALLAATARASPGVNLRWSNCLGDGGTMNRNFACETNAGSHVLVTSFRLFQPVQQVSGSEMTIDFATSSTTVPSWWAFKNAGSCRQGALSANFAVPLTAVNCVDWAVGQSVGGIGSYTVDPFAMNVVRLLIASAVPQFAVADLDAGQEYFSGNVVIHNQKTVGTGSCAGCDVPVCIILQVIRVTTTTPGFHASVTGSTTGADSFYATWQGGGNPVTYKGTGCPRATPTRRGTWGAVKSLYR